MDLSPTLSIRTHDFQNDLIDITFEIDDVFGWQVIETYEDQGSGTYTADTSGYVDEYDTEYQWSVTVEDEQGNIDQKTFTFTTVSP